MKPKNVGTFLLVIAIALVFTLQFGPGSRGCENTGINKGDFAAMVNGKEIPLGDYQLAYQGYLNYFRAQGNAIPESMAKQLGLPKQALDRLVDQELLAQAAEKQGIRTSDEELRKAIHDNADFKKDGVFDPKTYKNVVSTYYRKTVSSYETELRRRLAGQKILELAAASAQVTDDEVRARYQLDANRAEASFVRFLPSMFSAGLSLSDESVKAFADKSEAEMRSHFEKNKEKYKLPDQLHVSQILVALKAGADAKEKDEARTKLEGLRKQLVDQKQDFATIAKANSDDAASREKGGDLGFVDPTQWQAPLASAAAALKDGEISEVIQMPKGFYLLKLHEKKPAPTRSFEDLRLTVAKELLIQQNRTLAAQRAEEAAKEAIKKVEAGASLATLYPPSEEKATRSTFLMPTKPEVQESGDFNQSAQALPSLTGDSSEILRAIFATQTPGLLSEPFKVGDAFVVVEVAKRSVPSDDEFEREKKRIREQTLRARQLELRDTYLKGLKKVAEVQSNESILSGDAS